MSNLTRCLLQDVVLRANTGLDAIKRAPIVQKYTGVKCLRIQDISQNKEFNKWGNTEVKISDYEKAQLLVGDIIMARTCSPGIVYLVKRDLPAVFNNGLARIRPNLQKTTAEFLYYLFKSPEFIGHIYGISGGTSVQLNMQLGDLLSYSFLLPPLREQKAIAAVLSSLDDKIDFLHRQNKTLEAMAEALFRQWFIEEADEGWEEKSLLLLIELVGGGTPRTDKSEYWNGEISWISGGDITTNHKSFICSTEKKITKLGVDNSSTKILPKYSTVISARGTVGKYCMLAEPMAFSQSNYGVMPKVFGCYFFTYLLINHIVEELRSSAYGSVFDTITTNTFRDFKVKMPDNAIIQKFEKTISPYFYKILVNVSQIFILEKIRDTLLPKLMSGEVRVII